MHEDLWSHLPDQARSDSLLFVDPTIFAEAIRYVLTSHILLFYHESDIAPTLYRLGDRLRYIQAIALDFGAQCTWQDMSRAVREISTLPQLRVVKIRICAVPPLRGIRLLNEHKFPMLTAIRLYDFDVDEIPRLRGDFHRTHCIELAGIKSDIAFNMACGLEIGKKLEEDRLDAQYRADELQKELRRLTHKSHQIRRRNVELKAKLERRMQSTSSPSMVKRW